MYTMQRRVVGGKAKVLVVDDDTDSTILMVEYLRAEGYRPSYVSDGKQALAWIDENGHPDVIILDIVMPVMDGKAFLETYCGPAAIIVLTGWTKQDALPGEPFETVHKPCTYTYLADTIDRALATNGGPKWKRLLPCQHTCVSLKIESDNLIFTCLVPGCEKSKAVNKNRLDFETVLELTVSLAQDSLERENTSALS